MDISFFARSLLIGFTIAAVVGPIGILCINRTLNKGFLFGFVSGLGAATADAMYGSIAGFGLTVISTFLVAQGVWIRIIGGIFLFYLGLKAMLSAPTERAAAVNANDFLGAYSSTLLLTLTNPTTILSFAAVFAGIGLGAGKSSVLSAVIVVSGVFLGSTLWWIVLAGGVNLLRKRFKPSWLIWVNRISGGILLLFGALALISLRF